MLLRFCNVKRNAPVSGACGRDARAPRMGDQPVAPTMDHQSLFRGRERDRVGTVLVIPVQALFPQPPHPPKGLDGNLQNYH